MEKKLGLFLLPILFCTKSLYANVLQLRVGCNPCQPYPNPVGGPNNGIVTCTASLVDAEENIVATRTDTTRFSYMNSCEMARNHGLVMDGAFFSNLALSEQYNISRQINECEYDDTLKALVIKSQFRLSSINPPSSALSQKVSGSSVVGNKRIILKYRDAICSEITALFDKWVLRKSKL